jgi:two-component system OmpR family sensor kinase
MKLSTLNALQEAVIKVENGTITDVNQRAIDFGFKVGQDWLSAFTFEGVDTLTRAILKNEPFSTEANAFFFTCGSRMCKIIYEPEETLLFLLDQSEIALLKRVKTELVTSISHELSTPLSVAIGNVQILKDFMSTSESAPLIMKTQKSLNKIERIVTQLSLLTQAEFGSYSLHYEIFDPLKLLQEVLADLEDKIKKKEMEIKVICTTQTINSDRFVFYTIVRNLLSNAIKYSYENSEIDVTVDSVKIEVRDYGIGIRDQEKPRIFERFYRGGDANKYAKGSGLGLTIVKYLCEMCHYHVEFESTWMVGSTFRVKMS